MIITLIAAGMYFLTIKYSFSSNNITLQSLLHWNCQILYYCLQEVDDLLQWEWMWDNTCVVLAWFHFHVLSLHGFTFMYCPCMVSLLCMVLAWFHFYVLSLHGFTFTCVVLAWFNFYVLSLHGFTFTCYPCMVSLSYVLPVQFHFHMLSLHGFTFMCCQCMVSLSHVLPLHGFTFRMHTHVLIQSMFCGEHLLTIPTLIIISTVFLLHVNFKIISNIKIFVTNRTLVRFLSCVYDAMPL